MRFSFDVPQSPTPSPTETIRKEEKTESLSIEMRSELQWIPLSNHPIFTPSTSTSTNFSSAKTLPSLMAWDEASRLYVWDSQDKCLHRISVRLEPSSILAAVPSKVLRGDVPFSFEVNKISINNNGSAMVLAGLEGLCVMYLYGRCSTQDNSIICRTVSVGSEIYFNQNNSIGILQISWHPYSDTHLGIISSDSVFRLFDLSTSIHKPEQEYYLQPVEPGYPVNAAAICPVDFSFGKDHLWDKFSVFVLFSDGSVYIICPVVPFESVYKWESILELYNDAHTFGSKSANSKAANNSNLAITWMEAIFPELVGHPEKGGNLFAVKARPFVLLDASVTLQGPLCKLSTSASEDSETQGTVSEGRAVSLLYNLVGKDSVLVTAMSGGKLQLDALADEIQPVWTAGSAPRLCVDSCDEIIGAAMICESCPNKPFSKLNQTSNDTPWLGHPPPLLRLAIVDLALPNKNSLISTVTDPLVPERIFCVHNGGVDSIVLHFLPFTKQTSNKDEQLRTPSVQSVLNTCSDESSSGASLYGLLALSDSFGSSWIVGLTSSRECVLLQMDSWNVLLNNAIGKEWDSGGSNEVREIDGLTIISKELLGGPKTLSPSAPSFRALTADSIEGRSKLHQYFKLFHENYVEYAHKVYFELQHHAPHLKKIIDNQHSLLRDSQEKLSEVDKKQEKLNERVDRAAQRHMSLEKRLQDLRSLPGFQKKPLSKAERDFKSELDRFSGVELDALKSSINALSSRCKKYVNSPQAKSSNQRPAKRAVERAQRDDISMLKSSLEKLSLLNSENSKKVKIVEFALRNHEVID